MQKLFEALVAPVVGSVALLAFIFMLGSCAGQASMISSLLDGGAALVDPDPPAPPRAADASVPTADDAGAAQGPDAGPALIDGAQVLSDTLPVTMLTQDVRTAVISVKNTGTSTWTRALGYRLGAVGNSDPLTAQGRVDLDALEVVPPGASRDFTLTLTAPATAGTVTTDWQMLRENVQWFGDIASRDVDVRAPVAAPPFDLSTVTIVGSPDVRGFPVTSQITSVAFSPDVFHIDHQKRGQWPGVVIAADGTEQEATVWVFFAINGAWYGTGGERLRPNQNEKQLTGPSDIGPGWLYDANRWGVMTGYVPRVGDPVGMMVVAGSTRSDNNVIVQERTGVVIFPFPADGVSVAYPPFSWQEP